MFIWTSETQVMAKRRAGSQIASLTSDHKKSGIDSIYLVAGGGCHISLESCQRELQLYFRLHFNRRSACKVMGFRSRENPNWQNFGTPTRESRVPRKSHLDVASVKSCIVYYKGEGGDFPQVRAVVNLVCPCCLWLVLKPRVLQLCTNHFVWVMCKPV